MTRLVTFCYRPLIQVLVLNYYLSENKAPGYQKIKAESVLVFLRVCLRWALPEADFLSVRILGNCTKESIGFTRRTSSGTAKGRCLAP
jgi:hypothetical protein